MLKVIIAPVQQWLLKRGQCVGCGSELKLGKHEKHKNLEKVTCACGRIFIYSPEDKIYRRATLSEIE